MRKLERDGQSEFSLRAGRKKGKTREYKKTKQGEQWGSGVKEIELCGIPR